MVITMYLITFVLFFLWLAFAENVRPDTIIIGLIFAIGIGLFNKKLFDNKKIPVVSVFKKAGILIYYLAMLLKDIFIANFHVAKIVLSPKINIEPVTINYKTSLQSDFLRVLLANSITLTPGTLTVNMEDDILEVHCLDVSFAEDFTELGFETILMKVEGA